MNKNSETETKTASTPVTESQLARISKRVAEMSAVGEYKGDTFNMIATALKEVLPSNQYVKTGEKSGKIVVNDGTKDIDFITFTAPETPEGRYVGELSYNGQTCPLPQWVCKRLERYVNNGGPKAGRAQVNMILQQISKAIELEPNDAGAYYDRGNAYADYDKAISDYDEAIWLEPDNAEAYFNRGEAYAGKEDYDIAIFDYDEAIRLEPDNVLAYFNRGEAYAKKGDYDKAIYNYARAIWLNPNNAEAYLARGRAYADKKDYDKAIYNYTEAIRLDTNDAKIYNNRGAAYEKKGDHEKAIADYETALRIDPDNSDAKEKLEEVTSSLNKGVP
jgi:tetratricopeptide (TPR) repeat protein